MDKETKVNGHEQRTKTRQICHCRPTDRTVHEVQLYCRGDILESHEVRKQADEAYKLTFKRRDLQNMCSTHHDLKLRNSSRQNRVHFKKICMTKRGLPGLLVPYIE